MGEPVIIGKGRRLKWGAALFYAAVGLLALWLLWVGRGILVPLSVAFVIAIVLDPLVDRLENRGISRGVGTLLVFTVFLGGAIAALIVFTPILSDQASRMAADIRRLFPDPDRPDLVPFTSRLLERLDAHPALRDPLLEVARAGTEQLSTTFARGSELVLAWIPNLAWVVVVPVLAFYALMDFHRIYAKAVLLVPPAHRSSAQTLIAEISAVLGNYLRGLAKICVMLGASIALALWAWGNPYWPVLGIIGGVLYAIPVAGPLFNSGLVLLVSLAIAPPGQALGMAGTVFVLTSGLFDQVITPRVLGKQVGLHPILTIMALLLGFQVGGIGGMLVAVPLAACVQTIVLHLIPKLAVDLELRPLEDLKKAEAETREEHLEAEERVDDHRHLQTVIENVEAQTAEAA